jgi:CRISPR-associated protein Csh2
MHLLWAWLCKQPLPKKPFGYIKTSKSNKKYKNMNAVKKRSEILFLYDAKMCNPNGDPLDANRPRIDEETGKCLVTDVRLKRTIRDYLIDSGYDGKADPMKDIFIRDEDGKAVTGAKRSESYKDRDEYLEKFIDVRLFGGVSAPKKPAKKAKGSDDTSDDDGEEKIDEKKTFHYTGPIQFGMGKSLHPVKVNFIKGTGAFTTKEESIQKTFREEYNITYGLFGFHGVINEKAAKYTKTTEEDIEKLLEAIWNGTKGLLTRSKKGHMPRLLLKIGDLCERLKIEYIDGKNEENLEDVGDFRLNISLLNEALVKNRDKIETVSLIDFDDRLVLSEPIATLYDENSGI